jgi:hypothetical protein
MNVTMSVHDERDNEREKRNATKRVTNGYNDRQDTVALGKARSPAWR